MSSKKVIAFGEMFLLICMSFAIAFILSQNVGLVSAGSCYKDPKSGQLVCETLPTTTGPSGSPLIVASQAAPKPIASFAATTPFTLKEDVKLSDGVALASGKWDLVQTYQNGQLKYQYLAEGNKPIDISIADAQKLSQAGGFSIAGSASAAAKNFLSTTNLKVSDLASNTAALEKAGLSIVSTETTQEGLTTTILKDASGATTTLTGKGSIKDAYAAQAQSGDKGFLGGLFGSTPFGITGAAGHLVSGLIWAGVAAGAIQLAGKLFGLDKGLTNALTLSAVGGIAAYKGILAFANPGSSLATYAPFIGLGVAAAIFIMTYKSEKKKLVTFQCLPWEAPIGGQNCEDCNKDKFRPCSEYSCRSLGQACEIVNPGTAKEACVWVNPGDVNSPTIKPSQPLTEGLQYAPDATIRPPALGVKIIKPGAAGGCLQAFTPLKFSIETNEASQCKVDYAHTGSFENMSYFFGESNYFEYNHTQQMSLPGADTGTASNGSLAPIIQNDGTFSLYIRCQDKNGNQNVDEFSMNFCVDKGPDTTPPIIDGSSIVSGSPVQFNADSVPIDIYVNEPSECKWSRLDKAYDDMENAMTCATQTYQINSNLDYTCSAKLTGIKNSEDNQFYFRCKDQPGKEDKDRNVNTQSFPITLKGTQSLNILKTSPNGTISGSTNTVIVNLGVETANGAQEGKAVCYFSPTGTEDSFVAMFDTDNFVHEQSLDLTTGSYTYYFRCIDAGGNAAESQTTFNVFVDKQAPQVTRIYREGTDALKLVTNEDAECSYSLTNCNFKISDGIKILYSSSSVKNLHIGEWKPSVTYYIRCKDLYGNEPLSNECNIVASAASVA